MVDQAAPQQEDTRAGQEPSEAALAVCLAAASVLEAVPQEVRVDQVGLVVLEAVPQAAHNSQEMLLDSVLEGLEAHHLPLLRHLVRARLA